MKARKKTEMDQAAGSSAGSSRQQRSVFLVRASADSGSGRSHTVNLEDLEVRLIHTHTYNSHFLYRAGKEYC